MIDWLWNNRQWLFDGVGLIVISSLCGLVWRFRKGLDRAKYHLAVLALIIVTAGWTYWSFTPYWQTSVAFTRFGVVVVVAVASFAAFCVSYVTAHWRVVQLRSELRSVMAKDTFIDDLTNIPNTKALEHTFIERLNYSRDKGVPMSALLMDFDSLGGVNDTHGMDAGDNVLRQAVQRLVKDMRSEDRIIRYKIGDEFIVLASRTNGANALHFGRRICRLIAEEPFVLPLRGSVSLTASVGITEVDRTSDTLQLVKERLERALSQAKQVRNAAHLI